MLGATVTIVRGIATVTILDPAQRGAIARRLLDAGGPGLVTTSTERGAIAYRCPEHIARAAGVCDTSPPPVAEPKPKAKPRQRRRRTTTAKPETT